jgi:hypothetical protein
MTAIPSYTLIHSLKATADTGPITWLRYSHLLRNRPNSTGALTTVTTGGFLLHLNYYTNEKYLNIRNAVSWLNTWNRVIIKKLTVAQLVKKLPNFHEARTFITVYTTSRHCTLHWISWIQFKTYHPTALKLISILSSYLCLCFPNGLFPSNFPTEILNTFLISPMLASYNTAHSTFLQYVARTINYELCSLLQPPITSSHPWPNILLSTWNSASLNTPLTKHPVME